jgi:hypothetical protein
LALEGGLNSAKTRRDKSDFIRVLLPNAYLRTDASFDRLAPMYYRNAAAAVVVYDVTSSVG